MMLWNILRLKHPQASYFLVIFIRPYDTIEWNFIHNCIELYNFRPNIRKWISILYNNVEGGVMNDECGLHDSLLHACKVSRGVR